MPMTTRSLNLQLLFDLAKDTVEERGNPAMIAAGARVFERLSSRTGTEAANPPQRLEVCRYLEAIYSGMAAELSPMPEIASTFAAIEPRLNWMRRSTADPSDKRFYDGHANAMITGPGGIEQRDDVWVGVTLMAPDVLYPDHSHPPEELYLAFTDGEWWNAAMDWTRPGAGGLIYNPPGILHAMRSAGKPMLALWMLPIGAA
jgi:hypothetical protein